jgi:predicted transcriptional regulator
MYAFRVVKGKSRRMWGRRNRHGPLTTNRFPASRKIETKSVRTIFEHMKNITLSADSDLIERARDCARSRKSTLNALFREWLAELVKQRDAEERLKALENRIGYARAGRKFSREEMNAR